METNPNELSTEFTTFKARITATGEDGFTAVTDLGLKLYRPWENDWIFVDPFTEYLYLGGWFAEMNGDSFYVGQMVQFATSEQEQHDAIPATWDGQQRRGLTRADYGQTEDSTYHG